MAREWKRRRFLGASVVGLVSTASTASRLACGAEVTREVFTYKTVGKCQTKAVSDLFSIPRRPIYLGGIYYAGRKSPHTWGRT
jgi:hypothetical protein